MAPAKIYLQTDKISFTPGEAVTGRVYLDVDSPINCDDVVVKFTGNEKAEWIDVHVRMETDANGEMQRIEERFQRDTKNEFFKNKNTLCKVKGTIAPGKYCYPFSLALPQGLPGTFELKKKQAAGGNGLFEDIKGKVTYKLKATLDVNGLFMKDLNARQEIVVHEAINSAVKPAAAERQQQVMLLCCIPRGEVHLKTWFEKDQYVVGETAQIHASIENRSGSDVTAMVVKLMRTVTLRADNDVATWTECVLQNNYPGVPAGQNSNQELPLPLTPPLEATTDGKKVDCKYHVDVECSISMAPDVEAHVPVKVFHAAPSSWGVPPPIATSLFVVVNN